ncbi:MAG: hypothetical protein M1833_006233 [Piccolia ochrophora]|nr:MAG: hypothetical protein M1833_006233 [Piccolia ochrophora]
MTNPGPAAELFGRVAYGFSKVQPLIPTYLHLIIAALVPIYAGSHASLSRPSSAATPKKKKKDDHSDEDDDEVDEDEGSKMEGLAPTDALWFPLFAGMTLTGLYFLIKWLQDPALLNQILNWYFSMFGVFSLGRLSTDSLICTTSFIFPRRWSAGDATWQVLPQRQLFQRVGKPGGDARPSSDTLNSPLPGLLSRIPMPRGMLNGLWSLRNLLTQKCVIRSRVYGRTILNVKSGFIDLIGFFAGFAAVVTYNFIGKPWWLTNAMGFGFSYGALQLMSPTTFWTGTLILSSLFAYDIYFVFYTPLMITVAKSLDIPVKLLFPRPPAPDEDVTQQALAMLGLGDVVLPGLMVGLCLRFDLYRFYLSKQREEKSSKDTPAGGKDGETANMPMEVIKAKYLTAVSGWGERFWTAHPASLAYDRGEGGVFPKPYFYASLVGYTLGMVTTLGVMHLAQHAQPALLYLVPGVLGAVWGTALVRGEVGQMWSYSELPSGDEESPTQDSIFAVRKRVEQANARKDERAEEQAEEPIEDDPPKSPTKERAFRQDQKISRELFSITIIGPPPVASTVDEEQEATSSPAPSSSKSKASSGELEQDTAPESPSSPDREQSNVSSGSQTNTTNGSPRPEKRQRRK